NSTKSDLENSGGACVRKGTWIHANFSTSSSPKYFENHSCFVKRAIRFCETTSSLDPAYLYNRGKQS
ncbi:unnamed protein product, partial [Callosobruchus maculatus]